MDSNDMTSRILAAWGATDDESAEMARVAVEAIQCGKPHPDRPDIRCTDVPHERGPVYCRNSALRIEWWESPAGTTTVHDDLGPISLANLVAPIPAYDDGRGRYFKLPGNLREAEDALAQGRVTPEADAAWLNSTPWDETDSARDPQQEIYEALISLLDDAASKLRKLTGAYKGAATRGADGIAGRCEAAADTLRGLVSGTITE